MLGLVMPCFENDVDPYQPASLKVTDQNQLFTTLPLNQPYNRILCNTNGGKLGISVTYLVYSIVQERIMCGRNAIVKLWEGLQSVPKNLKK